MSSAVVSWIVDGVASAIALVAVFIALRATPRATRAAHDDIVLQLVTPGSELRQLVRNVAYATAADRFTELAAKAGLEDPRPGMGAEEPPPEPGAPPPMGLDTRVADLEKRLDEALRQGRNHLGK